MPALSVDDRVELIKKEIARYGGFVMSPGEGWYYYFVGGGPMIGLYRKTDVIDYSVEFPIEWLVGVPTKMVRGSEQGSHQQAQDWFKSMLPALRAWKDCIAPQNRGFFDPDFKLSFIDHPRPTSRDQKPLFRAFVEENRGILESFDDYSEDYEMELLTDSLQEIFDLKSDNPPDHVDMIHMLGGHTSIDIPRLEAYSNSPHSFDYITAVEQVLALHTAATLAGLSSDDVANLVAKEPWRCRQFAELFNLIRYMKSPRLIRGLARRYVRDNNLDAAANQLLPGVPRAKKLLPALMQEGLTARELSILRQAEIKDTGWVEKLQQKDTGDHRNKASIVGYNLALYSRWQRLVPGLTPSIYMNDIQLKYDARSTDLLLDTLRALNDHVHGLTQPVTLEQHPWIRNLYNARRDHKFNKLIAEHDRLNAVVQSLIKRKDDDPNSPQALWHANSRLFSLPKGMYALPTRSEQLEQGKQEQHCCGLYTWNVVSLVFGMKSPDTGATATLEIHIPTQQVRQFYGPHNSIVSDPSLIHMKDEFLASNRELMTRLTEQLRTKALR